MIQSINQAIKEELLRNEIDTSKGLIFLLSIFYKIDVSEIIDFKTQTKILSCNNILTINDKGTFVFKMPLFVDGTSVSATKDMSWVATDFCPLFSAVGRLPQTRECTERMEHFMQEYPEISKEEILAATNVYINNTDPKFVREPRYFIGKQTKDGRMSDLLCWIDKINEDSNRLKHTETIIEG